MAPTRSRAIMPSRGNLPECDPSDPGPRPAMSPPKRDPTGAPSRFWPYIKAVGKAVAEIADKITLPGAIAIRGAPGSGRRREVWCHNLLIAIDLGELVGIIGPS